jgi:HEAT repeat protein
VRFEAVSALAQLGSEAAIALLQQALQHSDDWVRFEAASALAHLGSEAAIALLQQALQHSNSRVRSAAARALAQLGSEAVIPLLQQALQHSAYRVRYKAARTLAQLGSEAVIPLLQQALQDSDYRVRRQAARALAQLGSEAAIPLLQQALQDSDDWVRYKAARALAQLGSEAAIPLLQQALLQQALQHSDHRVRSAAARALAQLGSEAAIPLLQQALQDSDHRVRSAAASALGQLGSEVAIPLLQQALQDYHHFVCYKAAEQLGKIGSPELISKQWQLWQEDKIDSTSVILAIQDRYQFYNYEIYQRAQALIAAQQPLTQRTILILAISAQDPTLLRDRLQKEFKGIDEGLRRARHRERFELNQQSAIQPEDLRRALLDYQPHIVHLCGHSNAGELTLQDEAGRPQRVSSTALRKLLRLGRGWGLACVVLNMGHSAALAAELVQPKEGIDYAIGMEGTVDNTAAIEFAVAFYDALSAGESYERAFEIASIDLSGRGGLSPVLKTRPPV